MVSYAIEASVTEGLETFARDEINRTGKTNSRIIQDGIVQASYNGDLRAFFGLRSVDAVYLLRRFAIPRPKALLGHAHFHALLGDIQTVRDLHPADGFATLHLDAAGSYSSVMQRLKSELADATGLAVDETGGDLLIRLRRALDAVDAWEALVRLTPRPLSTRDWRVCNYEGALNATVAHCMAQLTQPQPDDVFVNLACGSGTLLIERLAYRPARQIIGCDILDEALDCARQNIAQAGYAPMITLWHTDARQLPLPDGSVTALCADLPFGQLVGSHEDNVTLYPAILAEAARVAAAGARLVIITHEVRLMESLLAQQHDWLTESVIRVGLRGLHPRIYTLQRAANR